MRAFTGYKNPQDKTRIWQEHDSIFPYSCSLCRREYPEGGKRWISSSIKQGKRPICQCDNCHKGINPHRKKAPVLAERRTELD